MKPGRFDWPGLMRAGLGRLRLAPSDFWAMTPFELMCALEGAGLLPQQDRSMTRAGLMALMRACPDGPCAVPSPTPAPLPPALPAAPGSGTAGAPTSDR